MESSLSIYGFSLASGIAAVGASVGAGVALGSGVAAGSGVSVGAAVSAVLFVPPAQPVIASKVPATASDASFFQFFIKIIVIINA